MMGGMEKEKIETVELRCVSPQQVDRGTLL